MFGRDITANEICLKSVRRCLYLSEHVECKLSIDIRFHDKVELAQRYFLNPKSINFSRRQNLQQWFVYPKEGPPELISKVSHNIQIPGVGISDSRCIVKCDQKSPSVKATHIPPHSSGRPGWKIGPTLSSENHYHLDSMPDTESSSLLFASQAETFWNLYIFFLFRSFFSRKIYLNFFL